MPKDTIVVLFNYLYMTKINDDFLFGLLKEKTAFWPFAFRKYQLSNLNLILFQVSNIHEKYLKCLCNYRHFKYCLKQIPWLKSYHVSRYSQMKG